MSGAYTYSYRSKCTLLDQNVEKVKLLTETTILNFRSDVKQMSSHILSLRNIEFHHILLLIYGFLHNITRCILISTRDCQFPGSLLLEFIFFTYLTFTYFSADCICRYSIHIVTQQKCQHSCYLKIRRCV